MLSKQAQAEGPGKSALRFGSDSVSYSAYLPCGVLGEVYSPVHCRRAHRTGVLSSEAIAVSVER